MKLSVVIPVYKKKDMFMANLAKNVSFLKESEIIIVDDASGERLKEAIEDRYGKVLIIEHQKNQGFGKSVNDGVEEAKGEYVMLLNSDVILQDSSYEKALAHFKDRSIFAVSFAQLARGGSIVGKNKLFFKKGLMMHQQAKGNAFGPNAWADGGSCIIRREYFLKLSGFDRIYAPFYWEDVDLSYRAYKQGWRVLFDPEINVIHHHESTIGSLFSQSAIKKIAYRNQYIFFWKNVTSSKLWLIHLLYLPIQITIALLQFNLEYLFGLLLATVNIPRIFVGRMKKPHRRTADDYEILKLLA